MASKEQLLYKDQVRFEQLERLKITATEREKKLHIDFCADNLKTQQQKEMLRWIRKLYMCNKREHYFEPRIFEYRLFVKGYSNLKGCNVLLKIARMLYIFKFRFILQYFRK